MAQFHGGKMEYTAEQIDKTIERAEKVYGNSDGWMSRKLKVLKDLRNQMISNRHRDLSAAQASYLNSLMITSRMALIMAPMAYYLLSLFHGFGGVLNPLIMLGTKAKGDLRWTLPPGFVWKDLPV